MGGPEQVGEVHGDAAFQVKASSSKLSREEALRTATADLSVWQSSQRDSCEDVGQVDASPATDSDHSPTSRQLAAG